MDNKELIKDIIIERNPKALFLEKEFDEALIGSSIQCGKKHVATYDSTKCIEILMKSLNIGEIEAHEQFISTTEFSVISEDKPIIFSDFRESKEPKDFKIGND